MCNHTGNGRSIRNQHHHQVDRQYQNDIDEQFLIRCLHEIIFVQNDILTGKHGANRATHENNACRNIFVFVLDCNLERDNQIGPRKCHAKCPWRR